MPLFGIPWMAGRVSAQQSAAREVENLDRRTFSDPNLAAKLDEIASHYSLEVATLEPSAKRGSRRDIKRTDDFGETHTIWVMDVTIPFRGDPKSFQFSPSYCTIPSFPCEAMSDHLFVTLHEDSNLQTNVDQFIQQVSQNLTALSAEVTDSLTRLREALNQVADTRIRQIADQTTRNKNLDFPVD
ncbi:MAG TPA: hypothetical protein VHT02_06635 [Methylocella sp.]|jgi:hypothetical protein|nr:hypothetical protein [Methylocella sp.]